MTGRVFKIGASIAALGLVAAAGGAMGQAANANPSWVIRPTADQLFAVWPRDAFSKGTEGKVQLRCMVTVDGVLDDCDVRSQTPNGAGFGAAALALTPRLLMSPAREAGKPVVKPVTFSIDFSCGGQCGSGAGQAVSDRPHSVYNVAWAQGPTPVQIAEVYPAQAKAERLSGRVVLECSFKADGFLERCSADVEEPLGKGFAEAAMKLAPNFKGPLRLPSRRAPNGQIIEGASVEGVSVLVPITFSNRTLERGRSPLGEPRFVSLPSIEEMQAAFPKPALDAKLKSGKSTLKCRLQDTGTLTGCAAASEEPVGRGFGAAAVSLAPRIRLSAWSDDGLPTAGVSVNVPMDFQLVEIEVTRNPAAGSQPAAAGASSTGDVIAADGTFSIPQTPPPSTPSLGGRSGGRGLGGGFGGGFGGGGGRR